MGYYGDNATAERTATAPMPTKCAAPGRCLVEGCADVDWKDFTHTATVSGSATMFCLRELVCKQSRQDLVIFVFRLGFQLFAKTSDLSPVIRARSPSFVQRLHHGGRPIQDAGVPVH